MRSKKLLMFLMALMAIFVLAACGGDKEANKETDSKDGETNVEQPKDEKPNEVDPEDDTEDPPGDEPDPETAPDNTGSGDLNPYIAEVTGGDVEVVFENKNPGFVHHYSDEVSISIDEYQVVHVSNMNESNKRDFDDEEEGYVLTLKITLDNQSEDIVNYAGGLTIYTEDGVDNLFRKSSFVDRGMMIRDEASDGATQYSKGTFSGIESFVITKEQYERIALPIVKVDALWLNDDTSNRLGEGGVFLLPVSEAGLAKAEEKAGQYYDKMVTDAIADKELFFAKEDINETQEFEGVKITLNGVQYANATPTVGHEARFVNFGEGDLVALTVKYTIENGSDTAFDKFLIRNRLHIDDRAIMLSQGMLEPTVRGLVEPGETHEGLAVFLFREDEFSIIKQLQLEIGPLSDENAKRLFKEKSVTFDLPMQE